jgi:lipoate-protein ligase A
MICLETSSNIPAFNLAVEEVLLRKSDKEYFLVYINSPSVIVGKNQVANKEADSVFMASQDIPLFRRMTGGGTVFHDPGNINFVFIFNNARKRQLNFKKHTNLIIDFLYSIGVNASIGGKNDIRVDGLKISGNAEYVYRNRVIRHGTLLFDTDTDLLKNCIRTDQSNYITRTVASNPAEVVNIKSLISDQTDAILFKKKLLDFITGRDGNEQTTLPEEYINESVTLAESKYRTWDWNFGAGPAYKTGKVFFFNGKRAKCFLTVNKGTIVECSLNGLDEGERISELLIGVKHYYPDILKLVEQENKYQGLANNLF